MAEINNPYLEDKRKLMVALDKAKLEARNGSTVSIRENNQDTIDKITPVLKEIEKAERIFLIEMLNKLSEHVEKKQIDISEISNDVDRTDLEARSGSTASNRTSDAGVKPQDIYKRSCAMYKEIYNMLIECREIKKRIRDIIYYGK